MKLLLHVCCGPCSLVPVRFFMDAGHELALYFHNPNIQPLTEYLKRREAACAVAQQYGLPIVCDDASWNITNWLRSVQGNDVPPGRCHFCCASRVEASFAYAREHGFEGVSTSLLYSIYQPHEAIADAGRRLAAQTGIAFVYEDFRTGWQQGIDLSKEMELYRQPYCGCVYSEAERYQKKLKKLLA